jgi:putative transposase
MRRIDEPFTAWPFLGSRRMTAMLRAKSSGLTRGINRKRVLRSMRRTGLPPYCRILRYGGNDVL